MEDKICSVCTVLKEPDAFTKYQRSKDGLHYRCKECNNVVNKKWRDENKQYRKDYATANREVIYLQQKDVNLKRNYGINLSEYNDMFASQDGKCLGCAKHQKDLTQSLCVDHCHSTGLIRGLLCCQCNFTLGNAYESVSTLKNLIAYLEKYERLHPHND